MNRLDFRRRSIEMVLLMRSVSPQYWALTAAIIIGAVTLRAATSPLLIDDAYITFRYARNLAAGAGFVYNVGEQVLGTSTPLFTMLLAAFAKFGFSLQSGSIVLGVVSDAILVLLFVVLGQSLKRIWLGIVVGIWVASSSQIVFASVSGMETELYACLVVSTLVLYATRRVGWASFLGGLTALTRPEGGLVLVAIFATTLLRREFKWREWISVPFVLVPWGLFSLTYFGSLIPNSVLAKVVVYPPYAQPWHNIVVMVRLLALPFMLLPGLIVSWVSNDSAVMTWFTNATTVLFILALGWGVWSARYSRLDAMVLWLLLDLAFFALPNRYLFPWYSTPQLGMALFLAGWGMFEFVKNSKFRRLGKLGAGVAFALLVLLTIVMLLQTFLEAGIQKSNLVRREKSYLCLGYELDAQAPRDVIVASPEIGALGFGFSKSILDLTGLVSPSMIPYYRADDFHFHFPHSVPLRAVQDMHPEVLVLFDQLADEVVDSSWLAENYHRIEYYSHLDPYYGSLGVYLRNDQDWNPQFSCAPNS